MNAAPRVYKNVRQARHTTNTKHGGDTYLPNGNHDSLKGRSLVFLHHGLASKEGDDVLSDDLRMLLVFCDLLLLRVINDIAGDEDARV